MRYYSNVHDHITAPLGNCSPRTRLFIIRYYLTRIQLSDNIYIYTHNEAGLALKVTYALSAAFTAACTPACTTACIAVRTTPQHILPARAPFDRMHDQMHDQKRAASITRESPRYFLSSSLVGAAFACSDAHTQRRRVGRVQYINTVYRSWHEAYQS